MKVARLIHDRFSNDDNAHRWQRVTSCESKFRKWAKNFNSSPDSPFLGLTQMGETARRACRWAWSMVEQLRATKCWWKRTGWYQWSCA